MQACQRCGERFERRPRVRVILCPFHRCLYRARLWREQKQRYRARDRARARAFNAGPVAMQSR